MRDMAIGVRQALRLRDDWKLFTCELSYVASSLTQLSAADGIIAQVANRETLALLPPGMPTINVSQSLHELPADLPSVLPDQKAIAQLAFQHLLAAGYRRFLVAGVGTGWGCARQQEFASLCAAHDLPCLVVPSKNGYPAAMDCMERPYGVFGVADRHAARVARHAIRRGWSIPRHLGLVGVDDDGDVRAEHDLELSSIALDGRRIGQLALSALGQLMAGEDVPPLTLVPPLALVARGSSRPEPAEVEDPVVSAAVACLAAGAIGMLSPDDIAARVGVTRRVLDYRMQRAIGHSMREEIRRRRLELARDLLRQPDPDIDAIALRCGYGNRQRLAADFKRDTGTTPSQWARRRPL